MTAGGGAMERIPILQMGDFLLVTIQVDLHDALAQTLQDDLTAKVAATGARGVLIDISSVAVVDSFIGRMLNDIAAYTASRDLGGLPREVVAQRWLQEIYEPILAMIPDSARGKLEPAEVFHEILVHRWFLSERAGHSVKLLDAARDYIGAILPDRPEEALTTPVPD